MNRSSQHEDYILRQVRAVAMLLARILGLRKNGQIEEARAALDDAYGLLLDSGDGLVRQVDSTTAAQILSLPERIFACARLVNEEAALAGDAAQADRLRQRALELALEAALRGPEEEDVRGFVMEAAALVDAQDLGKEHRGALQAIARGGWPSRPTG